MCRIRVCSARKHFIWVRTDPFAPTPPGFHFMCVVLTQPPSPQHRCVEAVRAVASGFTLPPINCWVFDSSGFSFAFLFVSLTWLVPPFSWRVIGFLCHHAGFHMVPLHLCGHALSAFHVGFPALILVAPSWVLQWCMELVRNRPFRQAVWAPLSVAGFLVLAVRVWVKHIPPAHGGGVALAWAGLHIGCMPSCVNGAFVFPASRFATTRVVSASSFARPLDSEDKPSAFRDVFRAAELGSVNRHVDGFPNVCPFLSVLPLALRCLYLVCLWYFFYLRCSSHWCACAEVPESNFFVGFWVHHCFPPGSWCGCCPALCALRGRYTSAVLLNTNAGLVVWTRLWPIGHANCFRFLFCTLAATLNVKVAVQFRGQGGCVHHG